MTNRQTIFSECRKYRYTLFRWWGDVRSQFPMELWSEVSVQPDKFVQFLCLNPSTADAVQNDPTVTRCINYAKAWGYGGMCMTNLFAWRDTDPEKMKAQQSPISHVRRLQNFGPGVMEMVEENDYWIRRISLEACLVIAAWGKHGTHLGRDKQVMELIPNLHCLKKNKDGTPQHPLYLPKHLKPIPYGG